MSVPGSETGRPIPSASEGHNWPLCSGEGERKEHPAPTAALIRGTRGSWWGNPANQDAGGQDRPPLPLVHLFLPSAWASAAQERDQASEACSSLKLTA